MIIDVHAVLLLALYHQGFFKIRQTQLHHNAEINFVFSFNFDNRNEDLVNDMHWFEELRKLRVSLLKRELEHYDSSIGYASLCMPI